MANGRIQPTQHRGSAMSLLHILLERIDPSQNMARYYVLSIEPTLFGDSALVREWGRIGSLGQRRTELRAGSGKLDRSDKWSFCLKAA